MASGGITADSRAGQTAKHSSCDEQRADLVGEFDCHPRGRSDICHEKAAGRRSGPRRDSSSSVSPPLFSYSKQNVLEARCVVRRSLKLTSLGGHVARSIKYCRVCAIFQKTPTLVESSDAEFARIVFLLRFRASKDLKHGS